MPQEPEDIRQEMDETRNSLTDKINLLEEKVVETVHVASAGVKDTVEAMRDAVQDTVQNVRDSVGETVDSVKESFDLGCQVKRRPWTVMAGAAGAGFAVGYLLSPSKPAAPQHTQAQPRSVRRAGNGHSKEPAAVSFGELRPAATEEKQPSVLDHLTHTFEKEITQLKGLAIGTLAGLVRDLVVTTVPDMMRSPLNEVFNDVTVKLGGHPVRGQILPDNWQASKTAESEPSRRPNWEHERQTTM